MALWMGLFCSARSDPSGGAHSWPLAKVGIWGSTELVPGAGKEGAAVAPSISAKLQSPGQDRGTRAPGLACT